MPSRDPADRALIARIAASERWAHTADRTAATAVARLKALERFEDPTIADPIERARRAAHARRAYFLRLARLSAQARRKPGAA